MLTSAQKIHTNAMPTLIVLILLVLTLVNVALAILEMEGLARILMNVLSRLSNATPTLTVLTLWVPLLVNVAVVTRNVERSATLTVEIQEIPEMVTTVDHRTHMELGFAFTVDTPTTFKVHRQHGAKQMDNGVTPLHIVIITGMDNNHRRSGARQAFPITKNHVIEIYWFR